MLPQLRLLEKQFHDVLVVVGVHAGKYPNERRTPNIRNAVRRLGIDHPVLNDRKYRTWRAYNVHAWPTLALIDPAGHYLGAHLGEPAAGKWAQALPRLIAQYDERGLIDRRPLDIKREYVEEQRSALCYPEKVIADVQGRVFIADTAHHRVVCAVWCDEMLWATKIIGSGELGATDGAIGTASFNHPRGLALDNDTLYIADTDNHLLRAVDLMHNTVVTVAGTGERGTAPFVSGWGRDAALASPWDLVMHDDMVVIAMAGTHQLWAFDPASGRVRPLAGNGHEAIEDGPLMDAALAQPCGITSDGHSLYFADSESQAIRQATLGAHGAVITIVGTGLFDFADKDGVGTEVLLQHPQAVVARNGMLYIADSYNHKIKILDPQTRTCRTWLGARRIPGYEDGQASHTAFNEPGGLEFLDDMLLIADTNNHVIRAADLKTGTVKTLHIVGLNNA